MAKSLRLQLLLEARKLITSEDDWCRGALAITADRILVHPTDPRAVRRCALGALIAAAHAVTNDYARAEQLAVSVVRGFLSPATLIALNDFEGHEAALDFFDKAIAEEAQPSTSN